MRKIVLCLLCVIFMVSCDVTHTNFFDYQNSDFCFDCVLVYDGNENEAKITLSAPDENGVRETVSVEYISPSIIGGYILEKSGGTYKGKMGDVEIPFGEKTAGIVKKIESAFSLSEDMISDIVAADNGLTEATVISPDLSGKVITDSDGTPVKIELSFSDGHTLVIDM
ncbi:MAG: hypothetical protein IJ389_06435 [Clostridia bacterium]|nr:hypothetical protein [Clostridia bacterium]